MREPGSGTLEVIAQALKSHNIKLADLKVEMQLGGTESIKSYLLKQQLPCFSVCSFYTKELKNDECRNHRCQGVFYRTIFFISFSYMASPPPG